MVFKYSFNPIKMKNIQMPKFYFCKKIFKIKMKK